VLIKMVNGGVLDIREERGFTPGNCETCNWGEKHTSEFWIELTNVRIYFYGEFSDADMMRIFLPNLEAIQGMTEQSFVEWLRDQLKKELGDSLEYYSTTKKEENQ
jgi:hypothetical protein